MPAGRAGVAADGTDGGRDQVGGRGDEFHLVRLSQVGGFGGSTFGLVPASGVDVRPSERSQAGAAGALLAGGLEPLHGILQQGDRQNGFIEEPCAGTDSPQSGLVKERTAALAQVPDQLASAAERVGARPYPEPARPGINPRAMAGGSLSFQESENAAYGLAARERARMVDDGSRIREGIPGEGWEVTRCLFGNGDEGLKRG